MGGQVVSEGGVEPTEFDFDAASNSQEVARYVRVHVIDSAYKCRNE